MITVIQIGIFLAAFFAKKKYVNLILAVAYLFIPDEIPMIDEILMLAATLRSFYMDYKGINSQDQQGQITAGKGGNDVGT